MRAITVRQPYASLLMLAERRARKHFETRGYRPRCIAIGQEVAIHAGRVVALDAITPAAFDALGGRFAWKLEPTLRLQPGILLWTVPTETEQYILDARRAA